MSTHDIPKKIAVLIEQEFDAVQLRELQGICRLADIELAYLSHLWGHQCITFQADDRAMQINAYTEVSGVDPSQYDGLILLGGYAMDRLRYQLHPQCGQPNKAPAVEFLRRADHLATTGSFKIGAVGHGIWLYCAAPEILHGRQVTCAHNIIQDVSNAGGVVMFSGDQTSDVHADRGLLTGRDNSVAHPFFAAFAAEIRLC